MSAAVNSTEYTIFWQIDFRVVAAQIRLTQTVSLWRLREGQTPIRIDTQHWHLSHRKVGDGTLRIEQDHIVCDNAGLECLTVDLEEAIDTLAFTLQQSKRIGVSRADPLLGKENVSVRAVVDIPASDTPHRLSDGVTANLTDHHKLSRAKVSADPNRFHPIFFINQPEGYILLGEAEEFGKRYAVWTIDQFAQGAKGLPIDQIRSETPAYQLEGWHTLRVHQDGDRLADGDYLEFWVDQLPLGLTMLTDTDFPFRRLPTHFYIGAYPVNGDRTTLHCMQGKVQSFSFDPNDVCHSCF